MPLDLPSTKLPSPIVPFPPTLITRIPPFFFFNDTATTEIYTLSLHDALPISNTYIRTMEYEADIFGLNAANQPDRSEEHTSELQSRPHLVCRLLLEKKKRRPRRGSAAPPRTRPDEWRPVLPCARGPAAAEARL